MNLVERWQHLTKKNHTEGSTGVKDLTALCDAMGYGDHHGLFESNPLIAFLCDNPGVIEKIQEFIAEEMTDEWRENLYSELPYVEPTIQGDASPCPDCGEEDDLEQLEETDEPTASCKSCGMVWFIVSKELLKG